MKKYSNQVLKQITYQIFKERAVMHRDMRTNYRIERANGGLLCDLWFLTSGCRHDASGGCVMCNYGKNGGFIDEKEILHELEHIVEKLSLNFEDFLLTSSGSLLDVREVSLDMREKLIPILETVQTKRFIIETRSDTITDSGIDFLKRIVPDSEKYIEIGVESSDDWVLKYCINKEAAFQKFQEAVEKLHSNGIYVIANIGVGFPFMSEKASVRHSIQSIRDVLEAGADSVVLFPYHVKRGTLLDVMYQQGMYQPISLWAFVEVLNSFSEDDLQKLQISWYKDYFGEEKSYIYRSPGTCPDCREKVMKELDRYRNEQDPAIVKMLAEFPCGCKKEWRERLAEQEEMIEIEVIENMYRKLAGLYKLDQSVLEWELCKMHQEYEQR